MNERSWAAAKPARRSVRGRHSRPDEPRLLRKFAVLSLLPLILLGLVLGSTLQGQFRARALDNAKVSAQVVSRLGVLPLMSRSDLRDGLSRREVRRIDRALRTNLLGKEVAAIRVWNTHERIVYANVHRLIGRSFANNDELGEALDGEVATEVFDPEKASVDPTLGIYKKYGGLFEVYVPLQFGTNDEIEGVFELYLPYRPIAQAIERDTRHLYLLLGLGLLLLWLVLLPIAYKTGRQLRDQAVKLREHLSRERETVRRLRELDGMKSDFVSSASHELRTPLTAIIGLARTLRQPEHADNREMQAEFLERLERQGNRLLQLVDQLLHAAHLQGQNGQPQTEQFDLVSLVDEVVASIDGDHDIRVDISPDLGPVTGDRSMIGYVLGNVMANAVKYSPTGTPCTLRARADHGTLRIHVEDTGIGMSPEQLERAFDPFWQADSSSTRERGGVGLGLHLVKQLCMAMDCQLTVESALGKGTRFMFLLQHAVSEPVARSARPARTPPRLVGASRP